MRVKIVKQFDSNPAGTVLEIADVTAVILIEKGIVEKVKKSETNSEN